MLMGNSSAYSRKRLKISELNNYVKKANEQQKTHAPPKTNIKCKKEIKRRKLKINTQNRDINKAKIRL